MTHKICNPLEHTPWLEDKGGQGDFMQVHANPELTQERDQYIPGFVIEDFGIVRVTTLWRFIVR